MEQNQLYLIKQLERKIKELKKVIKDPDGYNINLATKDRVENLENRMTVLEKDIKEIKYILGK
jgi:chaperonin cofactor prefoldin|tara:strand:- start:200 stop:388 length:189 start_codon:yes stop_codon:yes gene_type:complete